MLGLLWWAAARAWPPLVAAALVVVADLALTGMLHFDGLVDSADGLLPHLERERRLEVMREPTVGAFGLGVGAAALVLRWAALAVLAPSILLLVGVWAASRSAMVLAWASSPTPAATAAGSPPAFAGGHRVAARRHRPRRNTRRLGLRHGRPAPRGRGSAGQRDPDRVGRACCSRSGGSAATPATSSARWASPSRPPPWRWRRQNGDAPAAPSPSGWRWTARSASPLRAVHPVARFGQMMTGLEARSVARRSGSRRRARRHRASRSRWPLQRPPVPPWAPRRRSSRRPRCARRAAR